MKSKRQLAESVKRLQAIKERIAGLRKELEEEQEKARKEESPTPE